MPGNKAWAAHISEGKEHLGEAKKAYMGNSKWVILTKVYLVCGFRDVESERLSKFHLRQYCRFEQENHIIKTGPKASEEEILKRLSQRFQEPTQGLRPGGTEASGK